VEVVPLLRDFFDLVIPCLNFAFLAWIAIHSRKWTTPNLNARLEEVEHEHSTIRGNLARVERDMTAWIRMSHDAEAQVLRELSGIREMLTEEVGLRLRMDTLVAKVDDIEQALAGLPCRDCPNVTPRAATS
jgi:hypothetical protein